MRLKEIGIHAQNMTTILGSISQLKKGRGGGPDVHDHLMSSKYQEESVYNLGLDLLTIMYKSHDSYLKTSEPIILYFILKKTH